MIRMGYMEDVEWEVERTDYKDLRRNLEDTLERAGKSAFDNSEFEDGRLIYEGLQIKDEDAYVDELINIFEDFFQIRIKRIDYRLDTVRQVKGDNIVKVRKVKEL